MPIKIWISWNPLLKIYPKLLLVSLESNKLGERMWQNFWKLWKLIERFSHTHDHKFMLLVFISWCLTDISLFFSLLQGLTNWWWRMESITYIGTRNFKRFQHFFFSNSTQLQYNLHIMWKGRNSKTKMKLCKRMMKKFLSLFFDVKVFFSSYFHPKNQLGFECKKRAENVCYTWFQRKFFNNNISLYLFASCIYG